MSALFYESFDHLDAATLPLKWGLIGSKIILAAGRTGANAVTTAAAPALGEAELRTVALNPATADRGFAGWAAYKTAHSTAALVVYWAVLDGSGNALLTVTSSDGTGQLSVRRGNYNGPILGTSVGAVSLPNVWTYLEFGWLLHSTGGYVEIRANGATKLVLQNVNTGTGAWQHLQLYTNGDAGGRLDDLYVCDAGGASENTFLGDTLVLAAIANADRTADWTPSSGATHYLLVNDNPPDSDASYVRSQINTQRETFELANIVTTYPYVHGVQALAMARKESSGYANAIQHVREVADAVAADGAVQALPSTAYKAVRHIWATQPNGQRWTPAIINASRGGVDRVS